MRFNVYRFFETTLIDQKIVEADSKEEAEQKARDDFNKYNKLWMEAGGAERKLVRIEVRE